jgi:hypothetical protein
MASRAKSGERTSCGKWRGPRFLELTARSTLLVKNSIPPGLPVPMPRSATAALVNSSVERHARRAHATPDRRRLQAQLAATLSSRSDTAAVTSLLQLSRPAKRETTSANVELRLQPAAGGARFSAASVMRGKRQRFEWENAAV